MRKFYSLSLAAACALIATAQPAQLPVGHKSLTANIALSEVHQLKAQGSVKAITTPPHSDFENITVTGTPQKAPMKAAADISQIEGDWNCTYNGMLDGNSGSHDGTATFTWNEQYSQFEVELPDCNYYLYADYEEETGQLTFNLEILGQNSSGYVTQWPMVGTTVQNFVTATYNDAAKTITFDNPNAALGIALLTSTSTASLQGYYWAGNNFTIERPDGDYNLNLTFDDECTLDNNFAFTITKGVDINEIYLINSPGDLSAADFIAGYEYLIPSLGQKVEAGRYKISPESQLESTEYYTVMAYGFNAAGVLVKKTQDVVFVIKNEDADYQKIGTIAFDDKLVNGYYKGFTNTKDAVEIQENINTPGLYRLVDAYAGQDAIHDDNCTHYIYIDAQDPEFVNINASATGLDFGDGMLVYGTIGGALGYSKAQCLLNGYTVGSLTDRTLTFPISTVYAHEKGYNNPGSWSTMNPNNAMTITLPDLVLNVTFVNANTAETIAGIIINVEPADADDDAEPTAVADEYVTGDDGSVSITLPASIDYLSSVKVTATNPYNGDTESHIVKLNGANNDYTFSALEINTGVSTIATDHNLPTEYYNLQGVRINNPQPGQTVIKKAGNNVSKIVIR